MISCIRNEIIRSFDLEKKCGKLTHRTCKQYDLIIIKHVYSNNDEVVAHITAPTRNSTE